MSATRDYFKDFEREFKAAQIPFKDVLEANEQYLTALYEQFVKTPLKPCLALFIKEHYSDEELRMGWEKVRSVFRETPTNLAGNVAANFYSYSEFEKHLETLSSEFYNKLVSNTLSDKYRCPDVAQTPAVRILKDVRLVLDVFQKSALQIDEINAKSYAQECGESVFSLLERLGDSSLVVDILVAIRSDDTNMPLLVRQIVANGAETNFQKNELENRWAYMKLFLNEMMSNKIDRLCEEPLESTPSKTRDFTVARQVLAVHFLLKQSGINPIDKPTEVARFMQFLTGRELGAKRIQDTTLYKNVKSPFSLNEAKNVDDLRYIRAFFEAMGLSGIVTGIDKEIRQSENGVGNPMSCPPLLGKLNLHSNLECNGMVCTNSKDCT